MKAAASSLQKGNFVNHNGDIWQIVKAEHNFHGRGSANYRFKYKSVKNANTIEVTCKPDNLFDRIDVDSIQMQYLYKTGDSYTFMNEQTYEQV
jgi:elongation factor P